jgi:hypothetical protein
MVVREWSISKPSPHRIRVDHWRLLSGRARVSVDGKVIWYRDSQFWDNGFECRFELDGQPCIVRVLYRARFYYEYELWVDGKLQ